MGSGGRSDGVGAVTAVLGTWPDSPPKVVAVPVPIPPALDARRALGPDWAAWLDALPRQVDDLLLRWHLTNGDALAGHTALVLPVMDADGVRRALKVGFRDDDSAGEIPTLQVWGPESCHFLSCSGVDVLWLGVMSRAGGVWGD